MAILPTHTHADPAVAGFDTREALGDLARLTAGLAGIRPLIEAETATARVLAAAAAPQGRTHTYRTAFRAKVFDEPDGTVTGKVFVIQLPWAQNRSQAQRAKPGRLWPKNLPLWLEYGTARTSARPHLIPAFERATMRINAAVDALLARLG